MSRSQATLALATAIAATAAAFAVSNTMPSYAVVTVGSTNMYQTDYNGNILVGTDLTASSAGLNDTLGKRRGRDTQPIALVLFPFIRTAVWAGSSVVLGSATIDNSQVDGLPVVVCGTATVTNSNFPIIKKCGVVDIHAAVYSMLLYSDAVLSSGPTGFIQQADVGLYTFTAKPGVNRVAVPKSMTDAAGRTGNFLFQVDGSVDATIAFYSEATNVDLANFETRLGGSITEANILWVFPYATEVNIHSINLKGSLIALSAATAFNNAEVHGGLYVASLSGRGEVHPPLPVTPPCFPAATCC